MIMAAIKFLKIPHLFSLESSFLVNADILFREGVLKCRRLMTQGRRPLARSIPIQLLWIDENFIERKKKKGWFVNIFKLHQRVIRLQTKIIEMFTCKVSNRQYFCRWTGLQTRWKRFLVKCQCIIVLIRFYLPFIQVYKTKQLRGLLVKLVIYTNLQMDQALDQVEEILGEMSVHHHSHQILFYLLFMALFFKSTFPFLLTQIFLE